MRSGRVVPIISSKPSSEINSRFGLRGRLHLADCALHNCYTILSLINESCFYDFVEEVRNKVKSQDFLIFVDAVGVMKLLSKPKVYSSVIVYGYVSVEDFSHQALELLKTLEKESCETAGLTALEDDPSIQALEKLMVEEGVVKGVYVSTSSHITKVLRRAIANSPSYDDHGAGIDVLDLMQLERLQDSR